MIPQLEHVIEQVKKRPEIEQARLAHLLSTKLNAKTYSQPITKERISGVRKLINSFTSNPGSPEPEWTFTREEIYREHLG